MIRKLPFLAVCAIALAFMAGGCRPSCDAIPGQSLASVRILNAVSNSSLLLVYIDGKLFDSCWYDVTNKYNPDWNPKHKFFTHISNYISDNSPLRAGPHVVSALDGNTHDTVAIWKGILGDYCQSLIFLGKQNGSAAQTPKAVYLQDNIREVEVTSFARFVDAVPDIDGTNAGGLDVYFSDSILHAGGVAKPSLRIHFGHISDESGSDNGTGISPNDYIEFPPTVPGLLILPVGDTNLADAILDVPYPLPTAKFLATIVVRGETQPDDHDPIASVLVMEDGQCFPGTLSFYIPSFLIRTVNATRYPSLSLLIKGPADAGPRAGIPANAGKGVLDLGPDSVGQYIPLNPDFDGNSRYWFSKSDNNDDTVFSFAYTEIEDQRTTFIAIDTIPHNTGTPGIDSMVLNDTVSNPSNAAQGRVRFVNTSSDYTANFTFAGRSYSMNQRDVEYGDTSAGTYTISVNGVPVTFTVSNDHPLTVFFMPQDATHPLPYRTSDQ